MGDTQTSDTQLSDLAALRIQRRPAPAARSRWRIPAAIGIAVAIALVLWGVGRSLAANLLRMQVEVTEIALVSPMQQSVEVTAAGYLVALERSAVSPLRMGRVASVEVRQGERVRAGQLLLSLDETEQVATLRTAESRLRVARAREATAGANLEEVSRQAARLRALAEGGAAPVAQSDDLQARASSLTKAREVAAAEVRTAAAEVEAARVELDKTRVRAPIDGTIVNRPPERGEYVGVTTGGSLAGLIEIADFGSLVAEVDVPEARLHRVRIGMPCEVVLDAYPDRRLRGETLEILPEVNRAKGTVGVRVKLAEPAAEALPSMAVRVSFLRAGLEEREWKAASKVVVPAAAVAQRGGATVVFELLDGVARAVPVVLGPAVGDGFELTQGPRPGTRVIKSPPANLEDGQKVKERTAS